MRLTLAISILFTLFQLCWAVIWAVRHLRIRRRRVYATQRARADENRRYKLLGPLLYFSQNFLCIASFWSHSQSLLKVHDNDLMRLAGVLIISFGTVLYFKSLAHLGRNYSPCFDSHVPFELISTGPYKMTRHPMYLAKLMVVIGDFVLSGSLWFVIMFVYLLIETLVTIAKEERYLTRAIPGYLDYQRRTRKFPPFGL